MGLSLGLCFWVKRVPSAGFSLPVTLPSVAEQMGGERCGGRLGLTQASRGTSCFRMDLRLLSYMASLRFFKLCCLFSVHLIESYLLVSLVTGFKNLSLFFEILWIFKDAMNCSDLKYVVRYLLVRRTS